MEGWSAVKPMDLTPRQKELYEKGRDCIAARVPGWDDSHPADPALAVLELGVVLSELQEQAFEQIDQRFYAAFLNLLGTSPLTLRPAGLLARPVSGERPYPGQRFRLGALPFETADPGADVEAITEVYSRQGGVWRLWDGGTPLELHTGDGVRLVFSGGLPVGKTLRLWCGIDPEPGRVPPDAYQPYPVRLVGYLPDGVCFDIQDGTRGLLQAGFLTFTLPREVSELRLEAEGEIEGVPRVTCLFLEPVRLVQRRTRSALFQLKFPVSLPKRWHDGWDLHFFVPTDGGGWRELGVLTTDMHGTAEDRLGTLLGDQLTPPAALRVVAIEPNFRAVYPLLGTAQERVALEVNGVLPKRLHVMVEEGGVWFDCPLRQPKPGRTFSRGCCWDGETGELCFGDGRDFRIPPPGRVLIASCACTVGTAGNGAAGALLDVRAGDDAALWSLSRSWGGRDGETHQEAFRRVAGEWRGRRAVSLADYEDLARLTPGLALRKVRAAAVQGRAGVVVTAMPQSEKPMPALSEWQRRRLVDWLEKFRLVGVPVWVRGPVYVPVEVSVVLHAGGWVDEEAVKRTVLSLVDGVTGPLGFGARLSQSDIFEALGALANVQAVEDVELRVLSPGGMRDRLGRVELAPEMLPWLRVFKRKFR